MFSGAGGLLDAPPLLHRGRPAPPPRPRCLVLAGLPGCGDAEAAGFEVVEDPETDEPGRERHVDHGEVPAEEEWPRRVGLLDEGQEVAEKGGPGLLDRISGVRLVLTEAVEGGHDASADEVDPDPAPPSLIRIARQQTRPVAGGVGVCLVQVLADDGALVQWLCFLAVGTGGATEGGDQTTGVQVEERLGFMVGIDLYVLIG